MLVAAIVHIGASAIVWVRGRRARGGHRAKLRSAQSWSAALMPLTGVVILLFVVFHVLDMTLGVTPVAPSAFTPPSEGDSYAYQNLIASFERPFAAWSYAATMALLSLHIAKGFGALAVDLGVLGRRLRAALAALGGLVALAVLLGNAAIPIAVQLGWLT